MRQCTGQPADQSKSILRRELRSKRNSLSTALRTRHDEAIESGGTCCSWSILMTQTPSGLDILIMPLVGYDRFGNRLGMGAGYYDRCLEPVRDSSVPLSAGIAYNLQEIAPVVKDKWDIPLNGVVNEHGWFTFVCQ